VRRSGGRRLHGRHGGARAGLLAHVSDAGGDGWVDVKIVLKAEKRA